MKRVASEHFTFTHFLQYLKSHKFKLAWSGMWVVVATVILVNQLKKVPDLPTFFVCTVNQDVQKGQLLQKEWITQKSISAAELPFKNVVSDCQFPDIFTHPVIQNLMNGDVLEVSNFEDQSVFSSINSKLHSEQFAVFIPLKDIHSFPPNIEVGQKITFFGKNKKAEQSEIIFEQVEVIDLQKSKDENDREFLNSIGIGIDQKQALSLTKALTDGWTIVIANK